VKNLGVLLISAFAVTFVSSPSSFLFAQALPNIFSGRADILYAQSDLLRSLDQNWDRPLKSTSAVTRSREFNVADVSLSFDSVDTPPDSAPSLNAKSNTNAGKDPPAAESQENMHFRWLPATGESLLYTGIMHSFDIVTQAGTRDSLNGHWFQHYVHSVSELRGWSDSDTFMAPYVGHPLEGSIFGFIERQNDPKYRFVQWGDGREYWISLLRSMAFSAIWHTQWKIGPISEDSIANVMLHASPGFITLVDTPTLGFCTMLAEDAADR
jgi:hypothetical protein